MFSSRKKDEAPTYPAVPDTLRPSYEMHDAQKQYEQRPDTLPTVTPYLSLRSRLSQIWMNRWTILLLLVLVRVIILIIDLNDNVGDAKTRALSACTKVEDIGSAMASMPHYLSVGVNDLAASGIEKSVSAMVQVLDLMIEGVQAMIIFFINFMVATYVCLITAMVHGSLEVVANVTEDASEFFNKIVTKVAGEISDLSKDIEDGLDTVAKKIEDSILGGFMPDFPTIDFSGPVGELKNFSLNATDFAKDVRKLSDDLPTFREVQNMTEEAISIPFDFVRDKLNNTYSNYKFDKDAFPLAQKQQLTFCSENEAINSFFDGLYDLIHKAKTIFIVVLVLAAIAAMAPMAWLEIKKWRRQQQHAKLIAQNQYDPMDVVYIANRPMTATWGIKIASRFSGKRQILVRWCIAYATSWPALFVLSLAIAGYFSCLCQYVLLKQVEQQVPQLASQVGAFADDVVKTLESVSDKWATDANGVVTGLSDDINKDILAHVTNATDAVNNTLTTFMDTMNTGLETAFNGTILIDPIKTVVYCAIGIKVENIQKGLTWVHEHAHVTFPKFDGNLYSAGANDSISGDSSMSTFLASPSSVTTDEVTGAVERVVNWLHKNIIQDALISTGLLLLYVIVILIGVVRTLLGMAMPDRGRAEGGMRYTTEDHPPMSPRREQDHFEHHNQQTYPRFGSSRDDIIQEQATGSGVGGGQEKFMTGAEATPASEVPAYTRQSSYGHFDSDRKY